VPADTKPAARPATANEPKNMVFFILYLILLSIPFGTV
jgi:hypothetical protein